MKNFKEQILEGIPKHLPAAKAYEEDINHAPKRKDILNDDEKKLALNICRTIVGLSK